MTGAGWEAFRHSRKEPVDLLLGDAETVLAAMPDAMVDTVVTSPPFWSLRDYWLAARADRAGRCAFATAPDVPLDATATLTRAAPMLPRIRAAGYPAALVAQDGLEDLPVLWALFDALFIGGSTARKLSPAASRLVAGPDSAGCGFTWAGSTADAASTTPRRSAATPLTARCSPTAPTVTDPSSSAG